MKKNRRQIIKGALALSATAGLFRNGFGAVEKSIVTRPIPHTNESLPVVGLGTAVSFPSADLQQQEKLNEVINALVSCG
jgi:hypothetical protein